MGHYHSAKGATEVLFYMPITGKIYQHFGCLACKFSRVSVWISFSVRCGFYLSYIYFFECLSVFLDGFVVWVFFFHLLFKLSAFSLCISLL